MTRVLGSVAALALALVVALGACARVTAVPDGPPGPKGRVDCRVVPFTFPECDKACARDEDCDLVFPSAGCCGAVAAVGIAKSAHACFDDAKRICGEQFPGDLCPSCVTRPPTSIEDGTSSMTDDVIGVACVKGRCTSVLHGR